MESRPWENLISANQTFKTDDSKGWVFGITEELYALLNGLQQFQLKKISSPYSWTYDSSSK